MSLLGTWLFPGLVLNHCHWLHHQIHRVGLWSCLCCCCSLCCCRHMTQCKAVRPGGKDIYPTPCNPCHCSRDGWCLWLEVEHIVSHRVCAPVIHLLLWPIHDLHGSLPLALQHGFEAMLLPGTVPSSHAAWRRCLFVSCWRQCIPQLINYKRVVVLAPLTIQQQYIIISEQCPVRCSVKMIHQTVGQRRCALPTLWRLYACQYWRTRWWYHTRLMDGQQGDMNLPCCQAFQRLCRWECIAPEWQFSKRDQHACRLYQPEAVCHSNRAEAPGRLYHHSGRWP